VASFAVLAPTSAAAAPANQVKDLGTLPGDASTVAMGINASGQVVGWSGAGVTHALVYTDGAAGRKGVTPALGTLSL
jgi:probable HAF family extracellular repeat protein